VNKLRSKFPPVSFSDAPYLTSKGFDLLSRLLAYDPNQRISAREALNHEYFKESPLPQRPEMMRTFPDSNDARE
jgi:cell division cycle 2-like protein